MLELWRPAQSIYNDGYEQEPLNGRLCIQASAATRTLVSRDLLFPAKAGCLKQRPDATRAAAAPQARSTSSAVPPKKCHTDLIRTAKLENYALVGKV